MSAVYSRIPPTIAPSRFAPNAVADAATSLNRWVKIRLAKKIGKNASVDAATNRGTDGQLEQVVGRDEPGRGQRRPGAGGRGAPDA